MVLAALVLQDFRTGEWIDEFATLWFSDPRVSLIHTYQQRWSYETNPPLYYFAIYIIRSLHDLSIPLLRLSNIAVYLLGAAYLIEKTLRQERLRYFAIGVLILFISSGVGTKFIADLRSYYAQFAFCIVFCTSLTALVEQQPPRRLDLLTCLVTSLVLINIHFMSAALTNLILVAAISFLLLINRRNLAVFLALCLLIGDIPEVAFIAANFAHLSARARTFWIDTPESLALREIPSVVVLAFGGNVVLLIMLAYRAIKALVRQFSVDSADRQIDASGEPGMRHRMGLATVFVIASAAFFSLLLIANLWMPIVIVRYLEVACAPLAVALVLLVCDEFSRKRWWLAAFTVSAAISIAAHSPVAFRPPHRESDAGTVVAKLVHSCRATEVYGIWPGRKGGAVYKIAYHYVDQAYGISAELKSVRGWWLPNVGLKCPTVLWVMHLEPYARIRSPADFVKAYQIDLKQAPQSMSNPGTHPKFVVQFLGPSQLGLRGAMLILRAKMASPGSHLVRLMATRGRLIPKNR